MDCNQNGIYKTALPGTSDNRVATTAFVTAVAGTIGQIPGSTDGSVAAPGNVGEVKSIFVPQIAVPAGSGVLLSSPQGWHNIGSIMLPPGDWSVAGFGIFSWDGGGHLGGNTPVGILASAISSVSADPGDYSSFGEITGLGQKLFNFANIPTIPLPIKKFVSASTQTVFLNDYFNSLQLVSPDTCYGGGFMIAVRAR